MPMTAEQRKARATKAAKARWAKTSPQQRTKHSLKMLEAAAKNHGYYLVPIPEEEQD